MIRVAVAAACLVGVVAVVAIVLRPDGPNPNMPGARQQAVTERLAGVVLVLVLATVGFSVLFW